MRLVGATPTLALVAMLTACVSRSYDTATVVRVGYPEPPATTLVTVVDDPAVGAALEHRLRTIVPMKVTSHPIMTSDGELLDPAEICRELGPPASENPPAEVVVIVQSSVIASEQFDCKDTETTGHRGTFDPSKGWVNDTRSRECVKWEYSYTQGLATARITALDRSTCTSRATATTRIDESTRGLTAASGTREENKARVIVATRAAIMARVAELDVADLLPAGVRASQQDARAELSGPLSSTLGAGRTYALRGARDGNTQHLGWLHIETASPLGAVGALSPRVEINDEAPVPKLPTLQVGDRIERLTHAHRWTGLPLVGVTRTDRGGDLTSLSGAVAVRWTYPRLFMHSDFLLAGHASRNALRHQESISFGPWIPLGGQFAVLGLAEAGLESIYIKDTNESGFVGVGGGVELWWGKTMFVLDVRYRWEDAVAENLEDTVSARSWMVLFGVAGGKRDDRPPQ